jgi:hypothetical protein
MGFLLISFCLVFFNFLMGFPNPTEMTLVKGFGHVSGDEIEILLGAWQVFRVRKKFSRVRKKLKF